MGPEIVYRHFPDLSSEKVDRLNALQELYIDWNSKINVISRKDIDQLYLHHVLHSLAIAKVISFKPGTKVLDVGTGGGFPGIPLAILFPDTHFVLVDSIGKKIKVVNEISNALGLKNVKGIHGRAEDIKESFDFVVSRAVTRLDVFCTWIKGKIAKESRNHIPNGILYLKGGDFQDEIKGKNVTLFPIEPMFSDAYFLEKFVVHIQM